MYVLLLFGEVIVGNMVESPSVGRETEQLRGLIKDLLVNSSQLSASRILDLLWFTMFHYVSVSLSLKLLTFQESHVLTIFSHFLTFSTFISSYRIALSFSFISSRDPPRPACQRLKGPCERHVWFGLALLRIPVTGWNGQLEFGFVPFHDLLEDHCMFSIWKNGIKWTCLKTMFLGQN